MAGGDANDLRAPWPKGEQGWLLLQLGPFDIQNNDSAESRFEMTVPFGFKPKKAYHTSRIVTSTPVVTIQDDSGTPKKIVDSAALAAVADEATTEEELTVGSVEINAGAKISVLSTAGASEDTTQSMINLWVEPVN